MAQFSREELDKVVKTTRKTWSMGHSMSMSKGQHMTRKDPGVKCSLWVAKTEFPAPQAEDGDACSIILDAIKQVGDCSEKMQDPLRAPVAVEWVGHRSGVGKDAAQPKMSDQAKFDALTGECHGDSSDLVMLYVYGGGHCLNGSVTRRPTAGLLSKLTGGRCMIVQYRLAPQAACVSRDP